MSSVVLKARGRGGEHIRLGGLRACGREREGDRETSRDTTDEVRAPLLQRQGVVTPTLPIEPFATGVKMSVKRSSLKEHEERPVELCRRLRMRDRSRGRG